MRTLVIGSGVIGMTTAITLQDAGHEVTIWAETSASETTSSKAAALWEPFQPQLTSGTADPAGEAYQRGVLAWGEVAYGQFLASLGPEQGVKTVRTLELKREDAPPWWAAGALGERLRILPVPTASLMRDIGPFAATAYTFDSIVIDMSRYLAYLAARFTAGRGERIVIPRRVTDLAALDGYDAVVNCAGLGARDLVGGDTALQARRGQIVRVRRTDFPDITVAGERISVLLDGDQQAVDARELTYLVQRFDDIVLGGTYDTLEIADERAFQDADEYARWSMADRRGILTRCADLLDALGAGDAPLTHDLRHYATLETLPAGARDDGGLRPFRQPIRVERGDDLAGGARLVHNYGHGGAGVTLSWGCARHVLDLL